MSELWTEHIFMPFHNLNEPETFGFTPLNIRFRNFEFNKKYTTEFVETFITRKRSLIDRTMRAQAGNAFLLLRSQNMACFIVAAS